MLLSVVLLYVGAVLCVNGIWLIGQTMAPSTSAATGPGPAPTRRGHATGAPTGSPWLLDAKEVAVINFFGGFVGVVAALTLLVRGEINDDLASVQSGGFILLFAFTYLWFALNQYLSVGGQAFGWYCLFVAVTALIAGINTLRAADGDVALLWLGGNWLAWSLLWAVFWALLALGRPLTRLAGWLAIVEGIATAWALALVVLFGGLAL